jgi:lipoprotein-anchoring transpeptidase ErfK/SrfK
MSLQRRKPNERNEAPVVQRTSESTTTVIRLSQRRVKNNPSSFVIWMIISVLILGTFVLLLGGILSYYAYYQGSSRVIPGVYIGQTNIGGMTKEDAIDFLKKHWDTETNIEISDGFESKIFMANELGYSIDAEASVKKALNIAHGQSMLAELVQMFVSIKDEQRIAPVIYFDKEIANQRLEQMTEIFFREPIDANIKVEEDQIITLPSELGYAINVQETLKMMENEYPTILTSGKIQIIPQPIAPQITDVTPVLEEAQDFLTTPIQLKIYDAITNEYFDITVAEEKIINWLIVEAGENGPQITFDEYKVAADLTEMSEELGGWRYLRGELFASELAQSVRERKPLPIIIASHTSTNYTTKPGDTLLKLGWNNGMPMWKILEANPDLDPDNILTGINLTIPSKDEMLPLPVIPNKRIIINISNQRLLTYQDGQKIGQHVISTGIDRSPTQPGIFQVQSHEKNAYASVWDLYMPNFLGIYESWPGFMNGIHGLPVLSNGQRLWANILGSPASYGCIIVDLETSDWLYEWAEDGIVVEIRE